MALLVLVVVLLGNVVLEWRGHRLVLTASNVAEGAEPRLVSGPININVRRFAVDVDPRSVMAVHRNIAVGWRVIGINLHRDSATRENGPRIVNYAQFRLGFPIVKEDLRLGQYPWRCVQHHQNLRLQGNRFPVVLKDCVSVQTLPAYERGESDVFNADPRALRVLRVSQRIVRNPGADFRRVSGLGCLVNLAPDGLERSKRDTPGPYRTSYERDIRQHARPERVVDPFVALARFALGIGGLWWGTRRYLRPGLVNERLGAIGLAIGFLALLLPW